MLQTTDELAAQVPGIKAEIEALKAGVPTDNADALTALEEQVNELTQRIATLAESFSQLDARLTGRVNDIEARVTQQANYLTAFAGRVNNHLSLASSEPREPGAAVVGGVPVVGTVDSQTGTVTPTGDGQR